MFIFNKDSILDIQVIDIERYIPEQIFIIFINI